MAIFLKTQPQLFTPAYNQIVYTADSNNKAQCNFRYIFDVYINLNFVTRIKMFPFGPSGWASVDVSRIVQDYVSYDLNNDFVGFAKNPNSIRFLNLQVGEEYDSSLTCTDGVTEYPALTQSDFSIVWNAAFQYEEFTTFDYTAYLCASGKGKWLSHVPDKTRIGDLDKFNLNFLQFSGDAPDYVEVKTYNKSMTLIDTYNIDNTYSSGFFQYDQYLITFGAGPAQLNSATLSLGSQPVIDDDVYYYSVQLFKDLSPGQDPYSDIKLFEMDKRNKQYEVKRLVWLNRLGGFDQYSYILRSSRNLAINRTEYNKKYGAVSIESPAIYYKYNVGDRGRTTLSVDASESYNYISDWLTQNEALWMEELFTSPEVYLSKNNPGFDISNGICITNSLHLDITGAAWDTGNHADLVIDDSLSGTLANGTTFTYTVDDGSPIGMADSGTGTITGFISAGQYHTNIPATVPAGALITGTLVTDPTSGGVGFIANDILSVGDAFKYCTDSGASTLGMPESGFGTVTSADDTFFYTDVPCTEEIGAILTGKMYSFNYDRKLLPLIIRSTAWEEKIKMNISNINYAIDLDSAVKVNVQRN